MSPNGDNDIQVSLWSIGDNGSVTGMSPNGDNDIQVSLWPIGDSVDAGMSPLR